MQNLAPVTPGGRAVVTHQFNAPGMAPPAPGVGGVAQYGVPGMPSYHAALPQDRLVRKEVALGVIREIEPPQEHIGLRFAPWQGVESDDVIFDYASGLVSGLAPARAEDAESELAQKDVTVGYGRAAIIDWALKDHYRPSDVSRYREALLLRDNISQGNFPLTITSMTEEFASKIARDERLRRRKLDNRFEWLIMQSLEFGAISYNDGKIKFTVDWGRPAGQMTTAATLWDDPTSDPIKNVLDIKQHAKDNYGVTLDRAICSERILNSILTSNKWNSQLGGNPNPFYTVEGWGIDAAVNRFKNATNVELIPYDAVYRTRPIGGATITNNRFTSDNKLIFLPSQADIEALDDTIGFGAMLTSPHPEGNWTSGFYEWERDTVDPWSHDRGTGCKAFPVFPHMELTYTLQVLA